MEPIRFLNLYNSFHSPICKINCGEKCAPYNEYGVPFCCDTHHMVPTAYQTEWEYLRSNTDLWHLWNPNNHILFNQIQEEASSNQVLIECLGHIFCQRDFRSITCRAFPFFPYVDVKNEFLGLTYYWEYSERCWIISNLNHVTMRYRLEFVSTFERLFKLIPDELDSFKHQSSLSRQVYKRKYRSIPLLHRNGNDYKISSTTGRLRRIKLDSLPKYGPYKIALDLPFPDEISTD